MVSWFRRNKNEHGDDTGTESTVEVKASVIADAAACAAARPPARHEPRDGLTTDGVVGGGGRETDRAAATGGVADPVGAGVGAAGPGSEALAAALAERRTLVQLCLYALDRARSAGVAERIEEGLAGVGVSAVRPDGVRFDPAHHEAGGTVATVEETLDGLVAETEVVGFVDGDELLRAPIVTVYRRDQS